MMEYPMINLELSGKKIKETIKEKGYTTKEIMEYMGFHHTKSIYAWYRGASLPSLENIMALSVLLAVPVNELLIMETD